MADPKVKLALRVHDECNGESSLSDQSSSNLVLSEVARLVVVGAGPPRECLTINLHPKIDMLTPNAQYLLGSDVFGSDICTWYDRIPRFRNLFRK